MINRNLITVDNTNFIYTTNFSGDPKRDTYGDSRRKVNILIPDDAQAADLMKEGFKVKTTKPGKNHPDPENFVPQHYIVGLLKYRKNNGEEVKWPPKVYLVSNKGGEPKLLSEETVNSLDFIRVKNVNVVLNPREYDPDNGGVTLYIRTMYVEQDIDEDPYAEIYRRRQENQEEDW